MTETNSALTADEISLYDRQIRLWGMEAQTSLRNSTILVINMSGVGVEIVKNLTLGGVGGVTIMDDSVLKEQDLNCNFFVDRSQVGELKVEASKARIQDMNPRVKLEIDTRNWETLANEDFSKFKIMVATGLNSYQIGKLNAITRELDIPLITCGVHGMYGFIFNDLIKCSSWIKLEHSDSRKIGEFNAVSQIREITDIIENDVKFQKVLIENEYRKWDEISGDYLNKQYPTEKKKRKKISGVLILILALLELPEAHLNEDIENVHVTKEQIREKIQGVLARLSLPQSLDVTDDELLEKFTRNAYCQYQPTNSIIGGVVSQDIVNTIVHKELPLNNFSILDGFDSEMPVYSL